MGPGAPCYHSGHIPRTRARRLVGTQARRHRLCHQQGRAAWVPEGDREAGRGQSLGQDLAGLTTALQMEREPAARPFSVIVMAVYTKVSPNERRGESLSNTCSPPTLSSIMTVAPTLTPPGVIQRPSAAFPRHGKHRLTSADLAGHLASEPLLSAQLRGITLLCIHCVVQPSPPSIPELSHLAKQKLCPHEITTRSPPPAPGTHHPTFYL